MKKIGLVLLIISIFFTGYIYSDDSAFTKFDENNLNNLSNASTPVIYSNGILFTYSGPGIEVKISGSFFEWEYSESMTKSYYGVWYYFLKKSLSAGNYSYKYNVDNFWILDPKNKLIYRDQTDHELSLLYIPVDTNFFSQSPIRNSDGSLTFWLEDSGQKYVYLFGNFNNWNPYEYPLEKRNNLWTVTLKLQPGQYTYKFIIDFNSEIVDPHNPVIVYDSNKQQCSIIKVSF